MYADTVHSWKCKCLANLHMKYYESFVKPLHFGSVIDIIGLS